MRRLALGAALLLLGAPGATGQELPPVGRGVAEGLDFPPLHFDPPTAVVREVGGVEVVHMEDRALPLVDVYARFRGGFAHFPRGHYAAGTALPHLLRNAGSQALPPDAMDAFLETFAIRTSFGGGGRAQFAALNVLRESLDTALTVWGGLLKRPRFDSSRVEVWRGRELESVLRRADDPGRLAFGEFNRLMYGDHPVGWEMTAEDLEPEDLAPERLAWLHGRIYCRENLVLGVAGDISWDEARPRVEALLSDWPGCPDPLPPVPEPQIRGEGGVFLIPRDVNQSTVVMAHAVGLHMGDDPDYFAALVGNAVLGGAGFQSRLMKRLRTEEGYAYSASSLWTTPREHPGLVGAVTRTRSGRTVAATRLVLEVIRGMTSDAPALDEVETVVSDIVNGFVFNFETPSQIVFRRMVHEAEGLPTDWLERYLEGIREVSPGAVLGVFREHVRPEEMTILVVGDPDGFDGTLSELGPLTVLDEEGRRRGPGGTSPGG